mgnify:CR=1 FL=1|tara:strand:+ start:805 stop:1068 length:264 start_codon:yes stop_codon:yes gene_type:complete
MNYDKDSPKSISNLGLDVNSMYKMLFIYNAINEGWTVKKLSNDKYEFKNNNKEIKKEFFLENFLDKFIDKNLTVDGIINSEISSNKS